MDNHRIQGGNQAMTATVTIAAFLIVGAFAAVLVILALCQAANDDANPKPNDKDFPDYED